MGHDDAAVSRRARLGSNGGERTASCRSSDPRADFDAPMTPRARKSASPPEAAPQDASAVPPASETSPAPARRRSTKARAAANGNAAPSGTAARADRRTPAPKSKAFEALPQPLPDHGASIPDAELARFTRGEHHR